jgi:hypothetical protein
MRGDLNSADSLPRESLETDRRLGRVDGQANQLGNHGAIAETRGNLSTARNLWTQSRDLFARVGIPDKVALVQSWLDSLPPA